MGKAKPLSMKVGVAKKKEEDSNYDGPDMGKIFVPIGALLRDLPKRPPQRPDTVDRLLLGQQEVGRFATFFLARLEPACGRLTYCNAGHNPPIFIGRDGCRKLSTGGTVVGIFPDAEYEQETIRMQSGDLFLRQPTGRA